MPSIKDTHNQMIQFVFPEYTNNLGTLHGGRLMDWIMLVGTITSSRVAKGPTVLGATDSIDFINPVNVGEIVILDSWVEYVGKSSMEVIVRVNAENIETGKKKFITRSALAFVAVDENAKPREVPEKIKPADKSEEDLYELARERRKKRQPEISRREEKVIHTVDEAEVTRFKLESIRSVMPEDAFYGNLMSVGKLLKYTDESAGILAMRYAKGLLVTGSLDNLFFYTPIRVGEVITLQAGITYTGNTSLEIAIKVYSENLAKETLNHTCTAFLTFVHIDDKGQTKKVPPFKPETPYELRNWKEAEIRRETRKERVRKYREEKDI